MSDPLAEDANSAAQQPVRDFAYYANLYAAFSVMAAVPSRVDWRDDHVQVHGDGGHELRR